MNTNDEIILGLKKKIEEKKASLKGSESFRPVTNCSLELDGVRSNIHTLSKAELIHLLVKLSSYKAVAESLGFLEEYAISSYPVTDWIKDLQSRLVNLNRKVEETRLKAMEDRLHELLSTDKKVEIEIEKIASSI